LSPRAHFTVPMSLELCVRYEEIRAACDGHIDNIKALIKSCVNTNATDHVCVCHCVCVCVCIGAVMM